MPAMKSAAFLKTVDIVKKYGSRTILGGISMCVSEGDVIVLLGANGTGKTTFLDILSGHITSDSGTVNFRNGTQWAAKSAIRGPLGLIAQWELPLAIARFGVRRIWQDSHLFPTLRLWENVAVAYPHQTGESIWRLALHPLRAYRNERTARENSYRVLHEMELDGRCNDFGDELSLGQEKRLAVRRTMEGGGRILLLDEPMAGLDSTGRELILDIIRKFLASKRTAVVVTEHPSSVDSLLSIATKVLQLEQGSLRQLDDVQQIEANNKEILARYINPQVLASFEHEDVPLPGGATLVKLRLPGVTDRRVALSVHNLTVFRGSKCVLGTVCSNGALRGLSFEIAFGEVAILVGPNGWGKTTLLEALSGLLPIRTGSVTLADFSLGKQAPWMRKRKGLRLLRARNFLFESLTAEETLKLLGQARDPRCNLLPKTTFRHFSGGERRRLGLMTIVRKQDTVTLVDEPFSGLDNSGVTEAWDILGPRSDSATLLTLAYGSKGGTG